MKLTLSPAIATNRYDFFPTKGSKNLALPVTVLPQKRQLPMTISEATVLNSVTVSRYIIFYR